MGNAFVQVDPKWAALILFSLALIGTTTGKLIGYAQFKRDEEAKNPPPAA